jgi:hypothetical protein
VLSAIFRAPIPASWFSETIEAERTYFPLNHAVSVYSRLVQSKSRNGDKLAAMNRLARHWRSAPNQAAISRPARSTLPIGASVDENSANFLAEDTPPALTIIGEAKNHVDLFSDRSSRQILAYLQHLRTCSNGVLIYAFRDRSNRLQKRQTEGKEILWLQHYSYSCDI